MAKKSGKSALWGQRLRSAAALVPIVLASGPALADAWDDLAARLSAINQGEPARRIEDPTGAMLLFEVPAIAAKVALVVTDGVPGLSYQFSANDRPSDIAFDLMAEAGSILAGQPAGAIGPTLHRCYEALATQTFGVVDLAGKGFIIDCVLVSGGQLSFVIGGQ